MSDGDKIVFDEKDDFHQYIYGSVRDGLTETWKQMLVVLGLFVVAIGKVLSAKNALQDPFIHVVACQLIWFFAMLELHLLSNYNLKREFLIELEGGQVPQGEKRKPLCLHSWMQKEVSSSSYRWPVVSFVIGTTAVYLSLVALFLHSVKDVKLCCCCLWIVPVVLFGQAVLAFYVAFLVCRRTLAKPRK